MSNLFHYNLLLSFKQSLLKYLLIVVSFIDICQLSKIWHIREYLFEKKKLYRRKMSIYFCEMFLKQLLLFRSY